MFLNEYQDKASTTAKYPDQNSLSTKPIECSCNGILYSVLELVGKSGRLAEQIKKLIRDNEGCISIKKKIELLNQTDHIALQATQCKIKCLSAKCTGKESLFGNKTNSSLNGLLYTTLGLVGESGEFAEKIQNIMKNNTGYISLEKKGELIKELGDVLWYVSQCANELDVTLNDVGKNNIKKLKNRQINNTLNGSGDNR